MTCQDMSLWLHHVSLDVQQRARRVVHNIKEQENSDLTAEFGGDFSSEKREHLMR